MLALVGSRKARLRQTLASISLWLSAGGLNLVPVSALAQANFCRVPAQLTLPEIPQPFDTPSRVVPIKGYTLALSWSPEFCRSHARDPQCDRDTGSFGFIIHGLWPEGDGRNTPMWCPAVAVPPAVARAQFCMMPSLRLMAHEWAKHGSCATREPSQYFAASRKLFSMVRLPDMTALSRRPIDVAGFKTLIAALNPAIPAAAIGIQTNDGWLKEMRVCLNVKLMPEACARNRKRSARNDSMLKIWRINR